MNHHDGAPPARPGRRGEEVVKKAKKWLEQAVKAKEKNPPVRWDLRLEWQLLRREAEQLLQGKVRDPDKSDKPPV